MVGLTVLALVLVLRLLVQPRRPPVLAVLMASAIALGIVSGIFGIRYSSSIAFSAFGLSIGLDVVTGLPAVAAVVALLVALIRQHLPRA